jgi:hypothetical protein
MYDNPPHFAALNTGSLDTAAGSPPPPAALDPVLAALADPLQEVLLTVQPAFVQRADVPFDVAVLADAGVLMDAAPPAVQAAGPYG